MSKLEPLPCDPSPPALAAATARQTERRDAAYQAAWQEIELAGTR